MILDSFKSKTFIFEWIYYQFAMEIKLVGHGTIISEREVNVNSKSEEFVQENYYVSVIIAFWNVFDSSSLL